MRMPMGGIGFSIVTSPLLIVMLILAVRLTDSEVHDVLSEYKGM